MTPEADSLVGRWRADHDWAARHGIGAHVTVRSPFTAAPEWDDRRLGDALAGLLPQPLVLARLEDRPGALVILAEPDDELRALTEAVGRACPGLPPHKGHLRQFAYHVTIVRTQDREVRDAASAALRPQLPRPVVGTALWAVEGDAERGLGHRVLATA